MSAIILEQEYIIFANGVKFYLPHGSGLDCKWSFGTRGKYIMAYNEYHAMDQGGMYAGYVPVKVKFSRKGELLDIRHSKQAEKDICSGYERTKNEYGDVETNEPYLGDLDDCIYQTVDCNNAYWQERDAEKLKKGE